MFSSQRNEMKSLGSCTWLLYGCSELLLARSSSRHVAVWGELPRDVQHIVNILFYIDNTTHDARLTFCFFYLLHIRVELLLLQQYRTIVYNACNITIIFVIIFVASMSHCATLVHYRHESVRLNEAGMCVCRLFKSTLPDTRQQMCGKWGIYFTVLLLSTLYALIVFSCLLPCL